MSSAAREEAIRIVGQVMQNEGPMNDDEEVESYATVIVDKLLETHAIMLRPPRVLVRSGGRPTVAALAGQKPHGRTQI